MSAAARARTTPTRRDDSRASTPTQAQVAAGLGELFSATSPESTDAAGCFGDRLAAARNVEQLTDDGVVDDTGTVVESLPPLTREAAAAWVDAWFTCIDFTEVAGRAQKKVTKTLDVAPFETCFRDRLTDDEIREAATDGLSGETTSTAVRRLEPRAGGLRRAARLSGPRPVPQAATVTTTRDRATGSSQPRRARRRRSSETSTNGARSRG